MAATTSTHSSQPEPKNRIAAPAKDQVEADRTALSALPVIISSDPPLVLGSPAPRDRPAGQFRVAAQNLSSK